jgi:hypothetical protein
LPRDPNGNVIPASHFWKSKDGKPTLSRAASKATLGGQEIDDEIGSRQMSTVRYERGSLKTKRSFMKRDREKILVSPCRPFS